MCASEDNIAYGKNLAHGKNSDAHKDVTGIHIQNQVAG